MFFSREPDRLQQNPKPLHPHTHTATFIQSVNKEVTWQYAQIPLCLPYWLCVRPPLALLFQRRVSRGRETRGRAESRKGQCEWEALLMLTTSTHTEGISKLLRPAARGGKVSFSFHVHCCSSERSSEARDLCGKWRRCWSVTHLFHALSALKLQKARKPHVKERNKARLCHEGSWGSGCTQTSGPRIWTHHYNRFSCAISTSLIMASKMIDSVGWTHCYMWVFISYVTYGGTKIDTELYKQCYYVFITCFFFNVFVNKLFTNS